MSWILNKIDSFVDYFFGAKGKFPLWDNRKFYPDYYIPQDLRHHRLTPEESRILLELPENKKCEECKLAAWTCACNLDVSDFTANP